MKYNPDIHHRQSIRLKGYDYSFAGVYFVTIRTNRKQLLFGEIIDGNMQLNHAGEMIKSWLKKLGEKYPGISLDSHCIMPDHLHCVISIGPSTRMAENAGVASLHEVIGWFKTMTTNEYIYGVKNGMYIPFDR